MILLSYFKVIIRTRALPRTCQGMECVMLFVINFGKYIIGKGNDIESL